MLLERLPQHFNADPKKVILLYLDPGQSDRLTRFAGFVENLSEAQAEKLHNETTSLFGHRHRRYKELLLSHAQSGKKALYPSPTFSEKQELVFGSFLTKEYSVEAAALFNPSIVPHPDQSGLSTGETRFVLTLRSVGEGHISSIGFMEGIIDVQNKIKFTPQGPWRTAGSKSEITGGDDDHYDIQFDAAIPLSERVIFPQASSESMGMEDLRMVKYTDEGVTKYLGTYTAYNGKNIQSKMLETTDFKHFHIRNLKGSQVDNKGMAFFPRKVGGKYTMLSRQGGESCGIMRSDDYMTWDNKQPHQQPFRDFELVQIGNCGSPIETPEGWLMLTHHVGPMRRYTLGVTLLDLDHPQKVIAILDKPLMEPLESEREGYVPNVLYTCGWMQHGENILIPYAMSDVACGFATMKTSAIVDRLLKCKKIMGIQKISEIFTLSWIRLLTLMLCIGLSHCAKSSHEETTTVSQINTAHLDALYDEIKVGEDTVGIIHIYSEYPDYHLVGDEDEGFACVDDASRACIFYLRQYAESQNAEQLRKGRMLLKFLLAMQAPNGYYYNFIWPDGRIHTDGSTSRPEPNFWSWRVLWAFGEAYYILDKADPLKEQINQQREKLVTNILTEPSFKSTATDTTNGWTFPTWLPKTCGADQAAIVLIGLSWMVQQSTLDGAVQKKDVLHVMHRFADGITMMQFRSPGDKYDGAFLSWENLWHAYANIQAYALLTAGQALKDTSIINHALYEVKTFYPSILSNGGLNHFWVRVVDGKSESYDAETFSQIAYGVRPMVWASLKAYLMTGDTQYLTQAQELTKWFSGNNPAKTPMYDPATGRGFDGISSAEAINKNAGAESTIEALLTIQALETYK